MVLEVLKFPDPRLRKKGAKVAKLTPELLALAQNMLETMYAEKGIGLAAPQVGESVRLLVIDIRGRDESGAPSDDDLTDLEKAIPQPLIVFNPEITRKIDKTTYDEGCLSVPGFYETVERAQYVEVSYLGADGVETTLKTDGLLAICLQHEMDHLDGKLFIDRLSVIKSTRIKNRIKKSGYPTPEEAREEQRRKRGADRRDAGDLAGDLIDDEADEKDDVAL
jgi:peptide deformylase